MVGLFYHLVNIHPFKNAAESRELILVADLHELRKNLYEQ